MKNTIHGIAALLLFFLLSGLAACGAPAGPNGNPTGPDSDTGNTVKNEIYDWLQEISTVGDDIESDEADKAFMEFAGALASPDYSYGSPLMDHYYRAELRRRSSDQLVDLTLVRRIDPGLDSASSLYLDESGQVQVGPSGMLKTQESGIVQESQTLLIFYRGKQAPCPLGLDWCEVEYWEKELCYYDWVSKITTQIMPPRVMASFTVTENEGTKIFIEAKYVFPHSDEEETVKGYFDTQALEFTETERTQRITN